MTFLPGERLHEAVVTPLWKAAEMDHVETIACLVDARANADIAGTSDAAPSLECSAE